MSDPLADLKRELVAAADRQQNRVSAPRFGRPRLGLLAATVAVAALVALLVTSPWRSSPGFLERAEAALSDARGGVLHMRWKVTTTFTQGGCSVTSVPQEIWTDLRPPYRYRAFIDLPLAGDCEPGEAMEIGGTFESHETLMYDPPNTLRTASMLFQLPPDPAEEFRQLLGSASDEGDVTIDGRTLRRILLDPCPPNAPPGCAREPAYVYLDPETYYPVEFRAPAYDGPGFDGTGKVADTRWRYLVYEYLPRTDTNLALTDIRAQHPNAVGP
jgi:hypothetical protein